MKKLIFLTLAFLMGAGVFANDLNVYPLEGVFVSKDSTNLEFKKILNNNRDFFIKEYLEAFKKYFPKANQEFSDKTKYKTFVSYIHIPRASRYYVQKPRGLMDIYLPLSASINFSNAVTGQIIYSYPYTKYQIFETTAQQDSKMQEKNIEKLTMENYSSVLDEILKKASEDFKPFTIKTKIKDTYRDFYILDKGLNAGIAKNDNLIDEEINQLRVIYSDLNYSVGIKTGLGIPKKENEYTKFSSGNSINQLKKPKILLINDLDSEMLYNIFSSALGQEANFALSTTDKTYHDMTEALISLNMDFKNSNAYTRELPNYFLKLYFTQPSSATYNSSNKDYFKIQKFGIIACGVIFDKTGRIVYSNCSNDEIKKEVVHNVQLNEAQNVEINTKNVLNDLAKKMSKDIQFKNIKFKITKIDGQYIELQDAEGFLSHGSLVTIYKKVKTNQKAEQIIVPTYDYRIISRNNSKVSAKLSKNYLDNINLPSKKDIAQMTLISSSASRAQMYNFICDELEGNEVKLNKFKDIALSAFASSFKDPISMNKEELKESFDELNSLGFKKKIELEDNFSGLSVKSVYKIKLKKSITKGKSLENHYEIIVGAALKKDGTNIKQDGLAQEVILVVPKEKNERIIEYELLKAIYPLISQIAAKL